MSVIPINLGFVYAYFIKGDQHSIIVDCGFPGDEKKILGAMEQKNIAPDSISLIVITHSDPDHYGGCSQLKNTIKAPVLAHRDDADRLATGRIRKMHASRPLGYLMKYPAFVMSTLRMKGYAPFQPDIIMQADKLPLEPYGIDGYLLHTPGETAGSISAVLNNGAAIVGDLLGGKSPDSPIPGYSLFYDDKQKAKESIRAILALGPRIIYTGHSKPLDVEKYREVLNNLTK